MIRFFKKIVGVCSCLLFVNTVSAQVYKQGVGLQLDVVSFKESYTSVGGLSLPVRNTPIPGILYKGSLGFALSRTTTLSITTYPFIGLGPKDSGKPKIVAEIPLLAEFFFGDVDYFGGFIGLGASYTYSTIPGFGDGTVFGPQIEGGIQFPLNDRVLAAKLSYTYGLNNPSIAAYPDRTYAKTERGVFGVGLVYMFVY